MVERFLTSISDMSDYIKVLGYLELDRPLNAAEVADLADLYQNYLHTNNTEYVKIGIITDLAAYTGHIDLEHYAAFHVTDATMRAIGAARDISDTANRLTAEQVLPIMDILSDDAIDEIMKAVLARMTLDRVMISIYFNELRDYAKELAKILLNYPAETLDQYTKLASEVFNKCRTR